MTSQLPDAQALLVAAEQAATAGDLAAADELLRYAARVQEAELGPVHPDLVTTLNNLAIVAEKTGREGDAETFYRRAAAIASVSLPADHPLVAASRQNLEDFCRACGLPIDGPPPVTMPSAPETEDDLNVFPSEVASAPAREPTADSGADPTSDVARPHSDAPLPVPLPPTPITAQTLPAGSHTGEHALKWSAIGVVVIFAIAALFATRPWSSRERAASAPSAESAEPQAAQPGQPAPADRPVAPPIEQAQPSRAVPRSEDREVVKKPPAPAPSSSPIVLTAAELCRTFSTSGREWRCAPAGESVAPGQIVLYTRLRSRRDVSITHRWYRGNTLRQAVTLTIRANWTAGYRTYSRQTVDTGEWRVEVRSARGDLLHEQSFAVQ